MKHQVKEMMLNYYQIEHFTRTTVSLLRENHIDCYLLKGLSLADCYPVPEYRKLGDLDLYLSNRKHFPRHRLFWNPTDTFSRTSSVIIM